jgi:hypothetical protein
LGFAGDGLDGGRWIDSELAIKAIIYNMLPSAITT